MARTKQTARIGCIKCRKAIHGNQETCTECKSSWHIHCASTTLRCMGICEPCFQESDETEISDLDEDTLMINEEGNQAMDEDNTFRVEAIVGHTIKDGKREFTVKWEDNSETIEPEENLDGCVELLKEYIAKYNQSAQDKLVQTTLTPLPEDRLGSSSVATGTQNWVTMQQILDCINEFLDDENWFQYKRSIPILTYEQFKGDSDAILLLSFEKHCYCMLYRKEEKKMIIADGNDIYTKEPQTKERIDNLLMNFDLVPMKTDFSAKVDQCGAAAVLIALELVRHFNGKPMTRIAPGKYIKDVITKRMHNYKSVCLKGRRNDLLKSNLVCEVCGKTFKTSAKTALSNHYRVHK